MGVVRHCGLESEGQAARRHHLPRRHSKVYTPACRVVLWGVGEATTDAPISLSNLASVRLRVYKP
jgi:hypothetical protein